jgi:hypothetical protein
MNRLEFLLYCILITSVTTCGIIAADASDISIYTASSLDNSLIELTTSCKSTHKLLIKTSKIEEKQKQILKWSQDMEDRCQLPINHKLDSTYAKVG